MLPFGVTIPATVPQGSEIPEGLMNNPVLFPSANLKIKFFIIIIRCHVVRTADDVVK